MIILKDARDKGFTLIELMITLAILGILAVIAVPRYVDLVRKAKEGETKGNLGAIRSSLSIYFSDMDGQFPADLSALPANNRKYISSIPAAYAPDYHLPNVAWVVSSPCPVSVDWFGGPCAITGCGWAYCDPTSGDRLGGTIAVNCTHTDTSGTIWTSY